ncbi:uncharacterized protein DUF3775 [Breoghania corrubedonensis]|uniref:Uncharacterized protein DUF3775 n=1 Tax=Breoghania corrubedonensis TaxID=665038 RepID=A0A2T5V5U2_9HYPH|nr:DUF3775 domain-containing protein [Breoghania corrubedonensis]PTW59111.1 uncharacterized protein DUF3775 [Breoghania corrubedonensis]
MAVELALNPDTVRMIVEKARAVSGTMQDTFEGGHEGEVEFDAENLAEAHRHEGLAEEESDDLTEDELVSLLNDLNVDEAAELVAITWIGRGDYEPADLEGAIEDARNRALGPTARYLARMSFLADYLEAGLDALDL